MEMYLDGQTIDLQELTRRELLDLMTRLELEADNITIQLDNARANQVQTGHYASADWFSRAKTALRLKRRQAEVLKRELSVRRNERITSLAELFIGVAKEVLTQDTFDYIMVEAKERLALDQQEQADSLRAVNLPGA